MSRDFDDLYRDTFAQLAMPLGPWDGAPAAEIAAAERRCGVRPPPALLAFYAVAGRVRPDHAPGWPSPPAEWVADRGRLSFLTEDRGRVRYGVPAGARADDPQVLYSRRRGAVFSPWRTTGARCSDFLVLRACAQAAGGGMPHTAYAHVGRAVGAAVVGRLGPGRRCLDLWAAHGAGRVVCLAGPLRAEGMGYDLTAGGRTADELRALVRELGALGVAVLDA